MRLAAGQFRELTHTDLHFRAYIATVLDRLARGQTIDRLDELLLWNIRPRGAS